MKITVRGIGAGSGASVPLSQAGRIEIEIQDHDLRGLVRAMKGKGE